MAYALHRKVLDVLEFSPMMTGAENTSPTSRRHHRATQIGVNAAEDLRFIREAVEHSSRFTDLPGVGMVVIGCHRPPDDLARVAAKRLRGCGWRHGRSRACWPSLSRSRAVALKARANGSTLFALPTRTFFLGLLPALVAGARLLLSSPTLAATTFCPGCGCCSTARPLCRPARTRYASSPSSGPLLHGVWRRRAAYALGVRRLRCLPWASAAFTSPSGP